MKITLNKADYPVIAGSLMAAIGAFMPMLNIAGLNKVSYADAASPQVYLLVALALVASIALLADKRALSPFAAFGAWLVLLWPVVSNLGSGGDDGGLLGKITETAKDPLQTLAQKLFSNVLDFELGGYVFLIGMVILLITAVKNLLAAKSK